MLHSNLRRAPCVEYDRQINTCTNQPLVDVAAVAGHDVQVQVGILLARLEQQPQPPCLGWAVLDNQDRSIARHTHPPMASITGEPTTCEADVDEAFIARAASVLVTGTHFSMPGADAAQRKAIRLAKANGAKDASYILLRLPHEVSGLFKEWLLRHYPDRYTHVLSLMRSMRGGKDYQAEWGTRMRGIGPYAWQVGRRFDLATRKIGLQAMRMSLRTDLFAPPTPQGAQLSLF